MLSLKMKCPTLFLLHVDPTLHHAIPQLDKCILVLHDQYIVSDMIEDLYNIRLLYCTKGGWFLLMQLVHFGVCKTIYNSYGVG